MGKSVAEKIQHFKINTDIDNAMIPINSARIAIFAVNLVENFNLNSTTFFWAAYQEDQSGLACFFVQRKGKPMGTVPPETIR
jgi:hypothetical protein